MWYKSDFATLTIKEIETLKAKMLKLPPLPMDMFNNILEDIDENLSFFIVSKTPINSFGTSWHMYHSYRNIFHMI